jgi:hypothetical protein
MGIYASLTSNIELSGVAVAKKAGRPMSITADAVHFSSCAGAIVIRDSLFEGQGDDGLNVHGKWQIKRRRVRLSGARVNHSNLIHILSVSFHKKWQANSALWTAPQVIILRLLRQRRFLCTA